MQNMRELIKNNKILWGTDERLLYRIIWQKGDNGALYMKIK